MNTTTQKTLKSAKIDTILGPMLAIGDDQALYLLEFEDDKGIQRRLEKLQQKTKAAIIPGTSKSINAIKDELKLYFEGKLNEFTTPLSLSGTSFQKQVWEELRKIPSGETRSYLDVAVALGRPTAFRAVAQANATNQFVIIIPCHRVINANGEIGGYGGGLARKRWLLRHEKETQ